MFLKNGVKFNPYGFFEHEGMQYSPQWFVTSTQEERDALGIVEVPDIPRPDDRFYYIQENEDGSYSTSPKDLAPIKARFKESIDTECGAVRDSYISRGAMVEEEYRRAYEDAMNFRNSDYNSVIPQSVKTWADVSNKSARWAADDIIITRNMYAQVLDMVRDIRLKSKAAIDTSTTPEELLGVLETTMTTLARMRNE